MSEDNKALIQRFVEEAFNRGNLDVIDKVYAPRFFSYDPGAEAECSPEDAKQFVNMYRSAFPDGRSIVEDLVAEGDKVAYRWTYRGTHRGELMGIAPTGREVTVTGITINRVSEGRIVEEWNNFDQLGMLQQLGVVPTPGRPVNNIMAGAIEISQFVGDFLEAWNTHDAERIKTFYAPEYEGEDVSQAEPQRGSEGISRAIKRYLQAFPDLRFVEEDIVVQDNRAVLVWTAYGTHKGKLMHIPRRAGRSWCAAPQCLRSRTGRSHAGCTSGTWPGSCEISASYPNSEQSQPDEKTQNERRERQMTTETANNGARAVPLQSASFERFAGVGAILAGVAGFLYAVAFIILHNELLWGLFLMLLGLFSAVALIAVYGRLRHTDTSVALLALLLGIVGALGAAVHGGYDLANAIHPPSLITDPDPVDLRGLLTFGVAGLALFVVAWLIVRGAQFPRWLGHVAYLSAVLLVAIYLRRLIVLDPSSPVILVPVLLNGFLVNPILYIWLGSVLLRSRSS